MGHKDEDFTIQYHAGSQGAQFRISNPSGSRHTFLLELREGAITNTLAIPREHMFHMACGIIDMLRGNDEEEE